MMGTSISKQKALLHRDRKENAINTHSLEIQKVIIFTNVNILIFICSNQVYLLSMEVSVFSSVYLRLKTQKNSFKYWSQF